MYVSFTDEEAKLCAVRGVILLQLVYISPKMLITDRQWRKILESSFFNFLYLLKFITLSDHLYPFRNLPSITSTTHENLFRVTRPSLHHVPRLLLPRSFALPF